MELKKELGIFYFDKNSPGFPLPAALSEFEFGFVESEKDYHQVLELRRNANVVAGKANPSKKAKDMADSYDSCAKILMVKKGDLVVGSIRAVFLSNFDKSDLYKNFGNIPQIDIELSVEGSRLCIDPEFCGIGLAYGLIQCCYLTIFTSGKRFIYAGASGTMKDFYKKLGWDVLPIPYECNLFNCPHNVIQVDLHKLLGGEVEVKPEVWKQLYKPIIEYLKGTGIYYSETG